MSIEEFADFEQILTGGLVRVGDTCWRRVRPCFYRPLWALAEYANGQVRAPLLSLVGGFQHAVPPGHEANSVLNYLIFDEPSAYSLGTLDYNRRRQVKLAMTELSIQPLKDVEEFKQRAYPIYLSFYNRTQYKFATQRRNQRYFEKWSDALFQFSKIAILGAYFMGELCAVSISLLVEDTLVYAMFFCNTQSLRHNVSDLMLHKVREAAAGCRQIKRIFSGMLKADKGVNEFYLFRGAKILRKPAALHVNPMARVLLERLLTKQHAELLGRIPDPCPYAAEKKRAYQA